MPTTAPATPPVAQSASESASLATVGAASSPTQRASSGPAGPALSDPVAIVVAYFSAITAKRYARAWELGGVHTGMGSYSAFVDGFATTASDQVTILSVSGNVVTARLTALQTNGTVKTFTGTYTVVGGVIIQFDVRQIN
jgi:hypothetical protein